MQTYTQPTEQKKHRPYRILEPSAAMYTPYKEKNGTNNRYVLWGCGTWHCAKH